MLWMLFHLMADTVSAVSSGAKCSLHLKIFDMKFISFGIFYLSHIERKL